MLVGHIFLSGTSLILTPLVSLLQNADAHCWSTLVLWHCSLLPFSYYPSIWWGFLDFTPRWSLSLGTRLWEGTFPISANLFIRWLLKTHKMHSKNFFKAINYFQISTLFPNTSLWAWTCTHIKAILKVSVQIMPSTSPGGAGSFSWLLLRADWMELFWRTTCMIIAV